MKYKIQVSGGSAGWADLKTSVDDGPYEDDHFDTVQEALDERRQLQENCKGTYRIVSSKRKADFDLYG